MSARVPHLALPFRILTGGAAAVTEQGSVDEITDCVQAVLRYPQGYRLEKPAFGLPDPTFLEGNTDATVIRATVTRWEPRAQQIVTANPDRLDPMLSEVVVEIQGRQGGAS